MTSNFRINNGNYLRFGLQSIRKISPCCGMSLENGARLIAVAQMVVTGICIGVFGIFIILILAVHEATKDLNDESSIEHWKQKFGIHVILTLLISGLIGFCLLFFLHRYLYKGLNERSYKKVNLWWNIMLVFALIQVFLNISMTIKTKGENTIGVIELITLMFDIYSLWVIYEYKTDLLRSTDPTVEFERVV